MGREELSSLFRRRLRKCSVCEDVEIAPDRMQV